MTVFTQAQYGTISKGQTKRRPSANTIALNSSSANLQTLLQNPIQFVPATSLTHEDEQKLPHLIRAQKRKREDDDPLKHEEQPKVCRGL